MISDSININGPTDYGKIADAARASLGLSRRGYLRRAVLRHRSPPYSIVCHSSLAFSEKNSFPECCTVIFLHHQRRKGLSSAKFNRS